MGIFPMSVANNFCDMPLPKYLYLKTVLIYRPHPVQPPTQQTRPRNNIPLNFPNPRKHANSLSRYLYGWVVGGILSTEVCVPVMVAEERRAWNQRTTSRSLTGREPSSSPHPSASRKQNVFFHRKLMPARFNKYPSVLRIRIG